ILFLRELQVYCLELNTTRKNACQRRTFTIHAWERLNQDFLASSKSFSLNFTPLSSPLSLAGLTLPETFFFSPLNSCSISSILFKTSSFAISTPYYYTCLYSIKTLLVAPCQLNS